MLPALVCRVVAVPFLQPHALLLLYAAQAFHTEKTAYADGWWHDRILLPQVNSGFEPIEIEPERAGDVEIVGE